MRYLGIDIGSSFIKGAVLDTDALRLSHIERVEAPPLVSGLDPMFREIEPEAIAQCVRRLAPSDEDTLFGLLVLSLAFTGRTASIREAIAVLRANQLPQN